MSVKCLKVVCEVTIENKKEEILNFFVEECFQKITKILNFKILFYNKLLIKKLVR